MPRTIRGCVNVSENGHPIEGVTVEVLALPAEGNDRDAKPVRVATGRTRRDGSFSIALPDATTGVATRRRLYAVVYGDDTDAPEGTRRALAQTRPVIEAEGDDDMQVRVPNARLKDAGVIARPLTASRAPSAQDLATSMLKLRDAAVRGRSQATAGELGRRLKLRRGGRDLATRLLGRKRGTAPGTRGQFVQAGEKPDPALERTREKGIKRLGDTPVARGARMRLAPGALERLFPDGVPRDPSPISPAAFQELKSALRQRPGASRLRSLLTRCRAEYRRMDLPGASTEDVEAPMSEAPASEPTDSAAVRRALQSALRELVEGSAGIAVPRPDVDAIAESLSAELPTGPADTTALYDFHRVQIAWQDTWTAAVDGMTTEQITDLYESIVETVDFKAANVDMTEIEELDEFLRLVSDSITVATSTPGLGAPPELVAWVPGLRDVWDGLSADEQEWLRYLHWVDGIAEANEDLLDPPSFVPIRFPLAMFGPDPSWPDEWTESIYLDDLTLNWGKKQAEAFVDGIDPDEVPAPSGLTRIERLLTGLNERLAEPYQFDVFVPDSYNYGILTTYRQSWKPLTYQVGDLVASMPLAPGETRSFETKRIIKTSRSQKEIEKSLAARTGESTATGRVESEIVQKATNATNFAMSGEGSFSVGIADVTAGSEFSANQASDSAQTKQDFRESVEKAAQEYRDERTLEISSEASTTGETMERRSIANPNNELTVTYLLYELQRRFEISERLHAVKPVVLVAFEVPAPDGIDEGWLVAHEWILRRVILHDRFLAALDYLTNAFAGDELSVEIRRAQWEAQMAVVSHLADSVSTSGRLRDAAREALSEATQAVADRDGLIKNLGEALFPSGPEEAEVQSAQREAAQRALEWVNADFTTAQSRLEAAVTALRQATDDYVKALQDRTNRRVAIDQLRVHVKQNILYYMQAVWAHEPPDQRYFRLYDLQVQWPDASGPAMASVPRATSTARPSMAVSARPATPLTLPNVMEMEQLKPNLELYFPAPKLGPSRPLHQVADLDSLLGFRGNYGIFALKEDNAITNYMAQELLDDYFGVVDPDPFGEVPTTTEALELAECAWNRPGTTDEDRAEITAWLLDVMAVQTRISEEIVVPTGQLFIEALPGTRPLLEDFKLQHRAVDLARAVTTSELDRVELLRRASRLAAGDLSDADIDQRIEVMGATPTVSLPAPPAGPSP